MVHSFKGKLISAEKHILKAIVAEDDSIVSEILSDLLGESYVMVFSVFDGAAAYDLFNEIGADLLITDLKMPVKDGSGSLKKSGNFVYSDHRSKF